MFCTRISAFDKALGITLHRPPFSRCLIAPSSPSQPCRVPPATPGGSAWFKQRSPTWQDPLTTAGPLAVLAPTQARQYTTLPRCPAVLQCCCSSPTIPFFLLHIVSSITTHISSNLKPLEKQAAGLGVSCNRRSSGSCNGRGTSPGQRRPATWLVVVAFYKRKREFVS